MKTCAAKSCVDPAPPGAKFWHLPLAQEHTNIVPPIPEHNYIIDNKPISSVIVAISVASKRVSKAGTTYSGAIGYNTKHNNNVCSQIPLDIATSKQSAYILTGFIAIKQALALKIKRIVILSKSTLLTKILSNQDYNKSDDIQIIAEKLLALIKELLNVIATYCDHSYTGLNKMCQQRITQSITVSFK